VPAFENPGPERGVESSGFARSQGVDCDRHIFIVRRHAAEAVPLTQDGDELLAEIGVVAVDPVLAGRVEDVEVDGV
jgi:hypothetical protein